MFMFKRTGPDDYHRSVEKLKGLELSHRAALDELDQAIKDKRAAAITPLRRKACESEEALQSALQVAAHFHRAYWLERQEAIMSEVVAAVDTLVRYRFIARAGGNPSIDPIQVILTRHQGRVNANEVIEDVPIEGPDSELLEDYLGCWR